MIGTENGNVADLSGGYRTFKTLILLFRQGDALDVTHKECARAGSRGDRAQEPRRKNVRRAEICAGGLLPKLSALRNPQAPADC
jgi:hypothetical protein